MNMNVPKSSRVLGTTGDATTSVFVGPGHLLRAICAVGATPRWVKIYDTAAAPTISDTPVLNVWCPVGTTVIDFGHIGLPVYNGLGHRRSTAGADNDATYTSYAAGDSCVTVLYQTGA